MKGENVLLKNDLSNCLKTLSEYEATMSGFQGKLDSLEDYSRRSNLRINGLDEEKGENKEILEVKVQKIFRDDLEMNNVSVDDFQRSILMEFADQVPVQ